MSRILTVSHLNVVFENRPILQDLSFELEAGEILAIIGPNGSGKTVLLRALLGLIPYSGTITWETQAKLGYVPQKIDADRHLPLNLRNLLEAKADLLKLGATEVDAIAERVGLSPYVLRSPIGTLSGGQFQKAFIAFALLGKPNVVLFDEPTASLDQLAEEHVYELLQELKEKEGETVVLVSHELSVVNKYATRVLCLNREKSCYGTPEEVLTPEILKEVYSSSKHHHHDH